MNRRNFILGLGTAATLSGAASVTGANLQDTVNPEADFRIIAAEELNVVDNPNLNEGSDANYTDVEPSSFDHNDTAASSGTNLTVNDGEDGGLSLALASGNNPDDPTTNFTDGNAPYVNESVDGTDDGTADLNSSSADPATLPVKNNAEAPIAIQNNTGSSQSVAIQYDSNDASYGAAINSGVSPSELETLFQFFIYDGNDYQQISPDGSGSDTPYSYVDVSGGSTAQVHLVINLTDSISQSIQDAADATGSGGFNDGATDDVDLLDTAAFGVDNA